MGKIEKGKQVTVKQPGIQETIFGKPRKIVVPDGSMLVCFKQASQKKTWLEVWRQPEDGRLRHPDLKQTILLDGSLSENGGRFITIDADLGVQVGYSIGETSVEVQNPNGEKKLQVVETREWVGIDGVKTWQNEQDLSFKQIALANVQDWLKLIKNMMTLNAIALIIVAIALIISSVTIGKAYDIHLPGLGK